MRKAWNKLSFEMVKKSVEDVGGTLVSTEYINAKTKLTFLCSCGEYYQSTFDNFKTRKQIRCRKCSMSMVHTDQTKTHEYFLQEVFSLVRNEYKVIGTYENSLSKVKMKHNCGFEYEVTPANFLKGRKCPKCSKRIKNKDTEFFRNELKNMVGNEYTLLTEYQASRIKVKVKHNSCGYEYLTTPNDFQQGKRCPRCRESKGEKEITRFLLEHKVKFKSQFTFKDLKGINGHFLKFDFAIFDESDKLTLLVEYDGEYHFKPKPHAGGKKGLQNQQNRDELKNHYCNKNKIKLVRIPYWQFENIDTILKDAIV